MLRIQMLSEAPTSSALEDTQTQIQASGPATVSTFINSNRENIDYTHKTVMAS